MKFWRRGESEVEFLRAQLAHRQRRIDELEDRMLDLLKPRAAQSAIRELKRIQLKPRGWEAYRAERRRRDADEISVQSEPDARSQVEAEDVGA